MASLDAEVKYTGGSGSPPLSDSDTTKSKHADPYSDDIVIKENKLQESAHEITRATLEAAASRLATVDKTVEVNEVNLLNEEQRSKNGPNQESEFLSKSELTSPVDDPLEKATKFLEKHQLLMLFQTLTSDIVLKRPSNPLDFMIDEIEKIQEQDRHRKGVFLKVSKQNATAKSEVSDGTAKPDALQNVDQINN